MIPKEAKNLIDEIERLGHKPRGKDKDLIESVKRNIAFDRLLSHGQSEWLQEIYRKAAGGSAYQKREYV